ncbi:hypothetical protein SAMN05216419_10366 [Nitrosomonas cryotolerans]|uniref:Uncharacterized protein n=1 Tax=Nitrosomonas cryotolerans ATCC 49181 TaxID=1131553 RepID=A0A1N6FR61_9PROT|nr:hypothetical protein [Nitrosomonas cryotolerans]SFP94216.1 hypothetical protein SAMN05216419_10366 [Nitrosomonas cryotolerans]SIN97806.1 hypothetical protein SAMN02743940_0367 [Nitrosomonas cryotolerans ATCC 49181]
MLVKKILFIIVLSFSSSHLVASESIDFAPNTDQQKAPDTNQLKQIEEPAPSAAEKDNHSSSNQQSSVTKTINMVDYCRKHTC